MRDVEHEFENLNITRGYPGKIYLLRADELNGCNFDCLVLIPNEINNPARIALSCCNKSSPGRNYVDNPIPSVDSHKFLGVYENVEKEKAILVYPYLTQYAMGPYYQQLTREALLDKTSGYERVDNQIVSAIKAIKEKLLREDNIHTEEKIDVFGFSAAGTFAQRFTALHYDIVRACCTGGAMDGVPLPVVELAGERLEYPLGIADFKELTGRDYKPEEHKKVVYFNWYGAKESDVPLMRNGELVRDKDGRIISNYDMVYIRSCTPPDEAEKMLRLIGRTPQDRFRRTSEIYLREGFDYRTKIYQDIGHTNTHETVIDCQQFYSSISNEHSKQEIGTSTMLEKLEIEQEGLIDDLSIKETSLTQIDDKSSEVSNTDEIL